MTSHGEARKLRRSHSRPGAHPSVAWKWSLESGLRSKDSRVVRRRVVGKVPIEATRWRPILLHVPFLGGWAGAIPPGYPAGDSNIISLPNQLAIQVQMALLILLATATPTPC